MKKYTLTVPVVFREGFFKLTKEQLARRSHMVAQVLDGKHKGLYEPTQPLQFKAGEVIEIVELPKVFWSSTKEGQDALEKKLDDEAEPKETKLRNDGPTLEEFVKSGYKAENYPPAGYAEKDSPALTEHKKQLAEKK